MDEKIDDEKFKDWVLRRLFVINEELGVIKEDVKWIKRLLIPTFLSILAALIKYLFF